MLEGTFPHPNGLCTILDSSGHLWHSQQWKNQREVGLRPGLAMHQPHTTFYRRLRCAAVEQTAYWWPYLSCFSADVLVFYCRATFHCLFGSLPLDEP